MKEMIDLLGRNMQERAEIKALKKKIDEEAAANFEDRQWRKSMAAIMTEAVYLGFEHNNVLPLMSNVETVGFDDRVVIKETRGLRAHWVARGGYIEDSELWSEVFELPRDTVGFALTEFEDKMRVGFSETQDTIIRLGMQRLDAAINQRFFAALQAAVGVGSPYYMSGAGFSLSGLTLAMRRVRDETLDGNIVIVGRATMTDQIVDAIVGANNGAGYLPQTNEDLLRRGVLGAYRGAQIITLRNYRDDDNNSYFPANELWVIGQDASRFAYFGDLLFKEELEEDNWYWHYRTRRDFGGVVHRPERLRRIVDTSITP